MMSWHAVERTRRCVYVCYILAANMKLWVCVLVVLLSQQTWGRDCDSDEFECDDESCVFDPFNQVRCDGFERCNDGSDEDGCFNIVGLIIGVSIGGFILTIIIPIVICAIIWCCVAQAAAGRTTRTVVATTPPYRTTVAAVSTTQQLATPVTYPIQGGYPAQDAPPPYPGGGYSSQPQPGYLPQQPTYPGYPLQVGRPPEPGYPPQEGYPLQETALGYPTKELEAQQPGYPPQEAFPPPQPYPEY